MDPDDILMELAIESRWEARADGLWVETPRLHVRAMARLLRSMKARWVTLTVTPQPIEAPAPLPNVGYRIIYHWDADGLLLNFATTIAGVKLPSIADLCPAADCVEREMHNYYALDFEGRGAEPAATAPDTSRDTDR